MPAEDSADSRSIPYLLNGKDESIALLRKNGAALKMSQCAMAGELCEAANNGDTMLVHRYLSAGINPNASDYDKRTGLMVAAAEGQLIICKSLLEANADPTLTDRWGHSAYDEAISNGHEGQLAGMLKT